MSSILPAVGVASLRFMTGVSQPGSAVWLSSWLCDDISPHFAGLLFPKGPVYLHSGMQGFYRALEGVGLSRAFRDIGLETP